MPCNAARQYLSKFRRNTCCHNNVLNEVTSDNRRNDAIRCQQLYVIVGVALRTIVLQMVIRLFVERAIAG